MWEAGSIFLRHYVPPSDCSPLLTPHLMSYTSAHAAQLGDRISFALSRIGQTLFLETADVVATRVMHRCLYSPSEHGSAPPRQRGRFCSQPPCTSPPRALPPPVWHSVWLLFLYGAVDSHPFFPSHVAPGCCFLSVLLLVSFPTFAKPSGWCAGAALDVACLRVSGAQ